MVKIRRASTAVGLAIMLASVGCAPLSREPTERERTAGIGGLAGGAAGAIIGSFAGSAVAGGLFGIPLGAVAGYYIGDQLASRNENERSRADEQERELDRLRRENERLRREEDRPVSSSNPQGRPMAQGGIQSEQNITAPPPAAGQQSSSEQAQTQRSAASQQTASQVRSQTASSKAVHMSRGELRQVQQKLNEMGYDAGQVDGIWGPNTQAAVRNFQHAKGLQATGTLDAQTADALGVNGGK
jgi:hypothetical protein